jgi:hypothetical protein
VPTKPTKPRTTRTTANGRKPPTATALRDLKPTVLKLDRKENLNLLAERVPLFSIGKDTYSIPKNPPASWTLEATRLAMDPDFGEASALEYVMNKMLGEDGYTALSSCDTLTAGDLETIVEVIVSKVIPSVGKLPKG